MQGGDQQRANLPAVRRLEAAGFRAWPATSVQYDGVWQIRLTGGHPAKRLNSVNPLDPVDHGNMLERIARAERRFDAYGRPLTFRMSPLASREITAHFDAEGWSRFGESIVMDATLTEALVADAVDQIPLKDMGRFVGASIEIGNLEPSLRPGLSEVISAIKADAGLFVLEEAGRPVSTAICVRDGDLAGIFEVATDESLRNRGNGRRVLLSALKWAQARGARRAWLQVEAANEAAVGLYQSMGFSEVYRYHYRQPPKEQTS